MPNRPAKKWMRRCVKAVAQGGSSYDPGGVCAATWKRKSAAEKRRIVREEEGPKRPARKPTTKPRKPARKPAPKKRAKKHYSAHELKLIRKIRETLNAIRELRGGRR